MKHRLSPGFRRGHATESGTLRGSVAPAPGGGAFPGVLGVAVVLGPVVGVPVGDEEEEEEEMSLSARAWGCWLSDSLWVGPPVSRAP